jgi:hypothetical protein
LWRIPGDDKQQFHIYSDFQGSSTSNLNAIADTHNRPGSVPGEFSPALSVD